jgi:hypothetical protein
VTLTAAAIPAELTTRRDRTRTPAAKAEAIRRRAIRAAKYGTRPRHPLTTDHRPPRTTGEHAMTAHTDPGTFRITPLGTMAGRSAYAVRGRPDRRRGHPAPTEPPP